MKKTPALLLFLMINIVSFSQFNPATNQRGKMENPVLPAGPSGSDGSVSNLSEVLCNENSFWAVGGGQIINFTLNGNTVVNNGNLMPQGGGSLAYCNNLDGGTPSPTFYTNSTFTKAAYYNGAGWTTCSAPPTSWIVNAGGNGNFLYFTSNDSVTYNQIGIVRYNGSSYSTIYTLSDTSRALTVADVAVDDAGNVWFFIGQNYNLVSDTLNVVSPSGQLLKQFPFSYNTYNAYGCFMMNKILYIGLGAANQEHPNTLIPVTISNNNAVAGTPIPMPTLSLSDLAGCNAGSPLSINENHGVPGLRMYPNPVKDILNIDFPDQGSSSSTLRIYNNLGTIVYQKIKVQEKEMIDVSELPAGIYFLMFGNSYQKIIKQ